MAKLATIARRTFLIGTGAAIAGLAAGTYLYRRGPTKPLLKDSPEGATTFNPYLRIDANSITLIK